ncbi:MAG TPA: glycosyltransferase [Bdellovibrionales bacterium]|nr:glycosyltransferase [Bdellovibrionales bacterium]
MRILQVGKYFPPEPGGMETSLFQLCSGLSEVPGIDVTCLVSNTRRETVTERMGPIRVIRSGRLASIASTPICPSFRSDGLAQSADLMHVHLPNPLATVAFARSPRPYVVTYHCDIVRYPLLLKAYLPNMRGFLRGARRVIATSQALIESSPVLSEFASQTTVIPLGLEPSHLKLTERTQAEARALRAKHGDKIVLFVGRLVPYKGLSDLIAAMRQVDGKLLIVGQGPERERLAGLIRDGNLQQKAELCGFIPDENIGAYYHASQIVALTSTNTSEAFGMCLLEGQACGKPLLTTRLPTGVATVNVENETGLHVDVGDVNGIAAALSRLLADESLRARLGENGMRHFQRHFDRKAVVHSHLQVYRDALGGA